MRETNKESTRRDSLYVLGCGLIVLRACPNPFIFIFFSSNSSSSNTIEEAPKCHYK